uniref:Uncharacterized protein n=1 Tax=Rhizophora mucronata TaxID=61149 RepID=A0A2P2Q371_RHIMU
MIKKSLPSKKVSHFKLVQALIGCREINSLT